MVRTRKLIPPVWGMVGLFAFLVGMSLFFFRGSLLTSDELSMAMTTRSLAENQSLLFDEPLYGKFYTNYGTGTPIAGLPIYYLEKALRTTGLLTNGQITLMPLTNAILFGLLGAALGLMMEGERRWWFLAVSLVAGPLFPASLTFYSEMLSAFGLALLAACLFRSANASPGLLKTLLIGAFLGAFFAMAARVALLPLLAITVFWGWRIGADRRALVFSAGGILAGVLVTLSQNWHLRGGPFAFPYSGQDFTTPVLTGLYGLLFSPERGILIFYPLLLLAIINWRGFSGRIQAVLALACALTIFSLVFHGRFWTWHGGWTTGPRFLLPCLALFAVPVADMLRRRHDMEWGMRLAVDLALIWSALLSFIYVRHSAFLWWNQLWGFHQIENQWLFFPQMSLWQAWFDGVPLPSPQPDLGVTGGAILIGIAIALIVPATYPLLLPFKGTLGTDPVDRRLGFLPRAIDRILVAGLLIIASLALIHLLAGPRGWAVSNAARPDQQTLSHLLVDGRSGEYEGWIDNPLASTLKFNVKANAFYWIYIDEQLVLEQTEPLPQHLNKFEIPVQPGYYQVRVRVLPKEAEAPPLFHLYWSWGGEGTYLAPAGGEYLVPRPLTATERFFTKVWRRKFILMAGALALLLLIQSLPGPRSRESLS